VGHLDNETAGGGMACASTVASAGATEAVGTTKTYTVLAELM
jgi:hypothetical protein